MIATKKHQCLDRNNKEKATTGQLKSTQKSRELALRGKVRARSPGSSRKRHSKAMEALRQHVRRNVGIGVRLPANHDEIAGEVAQQICSGPARPLRHQPR